MKDKHKDTLDLHNREYGKYNPLANPSLEVANHTGESTDMIKPEPNGMGTYQQI